MHPEAAAVAALIGLVSSGDRAAFSKLYGLTNGKLFAVALHVLGNRADAEEAVQESFLKIWRRAGSYVPGPMSPISWLARIARNQAIDMFRARSPFATDISVMPDLVAPEPTPEEAALRASQRRRVDLLIDGLGRSKATLLRDAYLEGLSYAELSDKYAVPVNTVRTRLRRGLQEITGVPEAVALA